MHKGTDFAAPMGTPIMASGDGVVKKAGWCGGGGNCVVIKHNSTYQTVYAHMSKFASGVRSGVRVKQGQTIGFVGSTGKSTGPHLHYEVIRNGEKINSQKLKLPSGKILKGDQRKRFELFGWAKSDKKDDYGPEWTRVAYVRRESSGAELVVLEDGQVWGETKRNGFVTLSKGDWVKIRGTSQLVRRGGGTTEVEALNCIKDDLKGRCRGLKKFL